MTDPVPVTQEAPMPADPVVAQESDGTAFAEVQCHCSDDDGVPDIGVSVGLGCGKALWIGELLTRDGATCGMVMHDGTKRIVAPFADGTEWQEVADILRHHVGPALAAYRPPAPAVGEVRVVPVEPTDEMLAAAARELSAQSTYLGWDPSSVWSAMLAATPGPAKTSGAGEGGLREVVKAHARWLDEISANCDMSEIVADGGITSGMVVQQEAREQRRRLLAHLTEGQQS